MTADPAAPVRLCIHDAAELAWGAAMVQLWLERRRLRLAAEHALPPAVLSESDHTATVSNRAAANPRIGIPGEPQ